MSDASTGRSAVRWYAEASAPTNRPVGTILAQVPHGPVADVFACPLERLGGDFEGEIWQIDGGTADVVSGQAHGWHYRRVDDLAFAALHIDDGATPTPAGIQQAARDAYTSLFALQSELQLPEVQRIWHWLSSVTVDIGDDQRYKRFCRGRAEALDSPGHSISVLPPATLVSGARRGVRLHALLGDQPVQPVENPRQISAYRYPRDYGERAPAFARAGVATLGASRYLLISGTASIVGHASQHLGDVQAQANEAMNNLAAVIEAAAPLIGPRRLIDLECIKAYVREPTDAELIGACVAARLPGVPIALLHAPLCRDDLLVEFEAQMRL